MCAFLSSLSYDLQTSPSTALPPHSGPSRSPTLGSGLVMEVDEFQPCYVPFTGLELRRHRHFLPQHWALEGQFEEAFGEVLGSQRAVLGKYEHGTDPDEKHRDLDRQCRHGIVRAALDGPRAGCACSPRAGSAGACTFFL